MLGVSVQNQLCCFAEVKVMYENKAQGIPIEANVATELKLKM